MGCAKSAEGATQTSLSRNRGSRRACSLGGEGPSQEVPAKSRT